MAYKLKLGIMSPVTVRYILESVNTLKSRSECHYVQLKRNVFRYFVNNFFSWCPLQNTATAYRLQLFLIFCQIVLYFLLRYFLMFWFGYDFVRILFRVGNVRKIVLRFLIIMLYYTYPNYLLYFEIMKM